MKKNVEEVFNLCSTEQNCINIGITCYKIGTLGAEADLDLTPVCLKLNRRNTGFKVWYNMLWFIA